MLGVSPYDCIEFSACLFIFDCVLYLCVSSCILYLLVCSCIFSLLYSNICFGCICFIYLGVLSCDGCIGCRASIMLALGVMVSLVKTSSMLYRSCSNICSCLSPRSFSVSSALFSWVYHLLYVCIFRSTAANECTCPSSARVNLILLSPVH